MLIIQYEKDSLTVMFIDKKTLPADCPATDSNL